MILMALFQTKIQCITLFSAARDDKTFVNTGCKYDVVTDGNYQTRRKLTKDEFKLTKGMMG